MRYFFVAGLIFAGLALAGNAANTFGDTDPPIEDITFTTADWFYLVYLPLGLSIVCFVMAYRYSRIYNKLAKIRISGQQLSFFDQYK